MVYNYPKTVKQAAYILDEYDPNWYKAISCTNLDMSHCGKCILGQVFSWFDKGIDSLFNIKDYGWACENGPFSHSASKIEWFKEIKFRRERRSKMPVARIKVKGKRQLMEPIA